MTKKSDYQAIKNEFGFKGNKLRVLEQFENHLREIGVLKG